MAFPVHYLTEKYDTMRDQQISGAQRRAEVFDLHDEPLLSPAGNLLGVRLRHSLRVPRNGRYRAGVTCRFTGEMIPFYLIPSHDRSGFCLSFASEAEKQPATYNLEARFRIHAGGTSLDRYLGGESPLTLQSCNLRRFYDGALAEGARRPCAFDGAGDIHLPGKN